MKMAQDIEEEAYNKHKRELDDPDCNEFYIIRKDERIPKRNSFRSMIELLKEYKEQADFIIEMRNSIAHNHYPRSYEITKETSPNGNVVDEPEGMDNAGANADTAKNSSKKDNTKKEKRNPYTEDIPKETQMPQIFETFEKKFAEATKNKGQWQKAVCHQPPGQRCRQSHPQGADGMSQA